VDKSIAANPDLLRSALAGLCGPSKTLEAKWFYDERGSALFERITELPEYYLTRTELAILRDNALRLAAAVPDGAALVELGSGASTKTRILLDALPALAAYCPVDISATFLAASARSLAADYPRLPVIPITADFLQPLDIPAEIAAMPKVVFFPGSTIGNLAKAEATALLRRLSEMPGIAALILGADLVKDTTRLIAAYDDAAGVTAEFNRNILRHLNREIGASFDPDAFMYQIKWSPEYQRIEMHLVSRCAQQVQIGGHLVRFAEGESIHTENCHKYTEVRLAGMAQRSGWRLETMLTDSDRLFSVSVLIPL